MYYNDPTYGNLKKDLNFDCKYYDEIQPHIIAYNRAGTIEEEVKANQDYFTFKQSVFDTVWEYPKLYTLEVVNKNILFYKIYGPIVDGISGAVVLFVLLQIIRMSYVYVVFGEVVWHPFRQRRKEK